VKEPQPRPYTVEEMREMFVDHLRGLTRFWATAEITADRDPTLARLEGLLHSVLATLDGCTSLPAFDLIPAPHESDQSYFLDEGENWWVPEVINGDVHLHDMLGPKRR
jgi:hypothetical protein